MIMEIIKAFIAGLVVGGVFSFFRLPIPAPTALAGIAGIVGLFIGYLIISRFK